MKPRKGVSKRRWKARARAGRWLPTAVVFAIDKDPDPLTERWLPHPYEPDFWRLISSWKRVKVTHGGHQKLAEVAEVGL